MAPRCARLPRYSFRSDADSVIDLSPHHTTSFCPGANTALATSSSSRAAAFFVGMSNSLLPLPRGSSGTSFNGSTSRRPSSFTSATSASADGTGCGGSTFALSLRFSTALPALRSVMSSCSLIV